MSSTKRGRSRRPSDNYPTPFWCVRRLLEGVILPSGEWLEPCAGNGAIIRAVNERHGNSITWTAVEIRGKAAHQIELIPKRRRDSINVYVGDFLKMHEEDKGATRFKVGISNPPFSLAMPFIRACREVCDHTLMLLRLNFLASEERRAFMQQTKPDVYVLPNRPSFVLAGKTDSIEYAWFHWYTGSEGKCVVLNATSIEERRADRRP